MRPRDRSGQQPSWRRYLRFWGPNVPADVDDELSFHVAMLVEEHIASGMSPEEARRAALARFGKYDTVRRDCERIGQETRAMMRRREWLEATVADVRYGLRQIRANTLVSAVAILTLALGIGANTAIFSVVNGVLLNPLPFGDAGRVTMVWNDYSTFTVRTDITSYPTYADWKQQNRVFHDIAGFMRGQTNLTGTGEPQRVRRAWVTPNFLDVVRVAPLLGRGFVAAEGEQGNERVVILGHGLWRQRFGGDPGALGQKVRLNGTEFEIVGVMPPRFDFPEHADVWTPLAPSPQMRQARQSFWLYAVGRLKDGVSIEAAQADMDRVSRQLRQAYPDAMEAQEVFVQPIADHLVGSIRPALLVLLGAVGLVLLVACANVANLLLARAAVREREIAVRLALGAGRGRLVRQLLTESMVVGLVGGALALGFAYLGVDLLRSVAPADLPRLDEVAVDGRVLGFTLLLSVVTGLVFGLVPALQASRVAMTEPLKEGARGMAGGSGRRVRSALVVAEVAVALVLLVGAGLLIRSFLHLRGIDSGFRQRGVLTARLTLTGTNYSNPEQVLGFYDRLFERLRALPGVESVAGGTDVLLDELPNSGGVSIEGRPRDPADRSEVTVDVVTPGFFPTVGTRLLRGRDFSDEDRAGTQPVAIINDAMARAYWPGQDPVGKRFKWGRAESQSPWRTVVGVVADSRRTAPDKEARPSGYVAFRQSPNATMMLTLRTSQDPLGLAGPLRDGVRAIDANLPVAQVQTLEAMLADRLAERRLTMVLAGMFSGLALLLALVGVYGVVSYSVSQSTREFGVRMALGAGGGAIQALVLGRTARLVAIGLAFGLAGSLAVTRVLAGLLYGVSALDPVTFVLVPLLVAAVALAASYVPARRAARVAPVVALRAE